MLPLCESNVTSVNQMLSLYISATCILSNVTSMNQMLSLYNSATCILSNVTSLCLSPVCNIMLPLYTYVTFM